MNYFSRLIALFRVMRTIASVYGRGSKMLLWFKMIMTVLQPRLPRTMRSAQRLDLVLQGKPFSLWMRDRTSLAAFEEVFIHGEYLVADIPQPRTILDAGANIGVASVYFCVRYPEARLYAVEPDADVCMTLRQNLAAFPNATAYQCALADVDGAVDFHVHPTSSIASSLQSRVLGERIVSVPSKTLDTFMREEGIPSLDLFKFDVEGAEDRLLRSIKDRHSVRCYVGEIHPDLMSTSPEDIVALFAGFSVKTESISSKRFVLTATSKMLRH